MSYCGGEEHTVRMREDNLHLLFELTVAAGRGWG
jgi:hypothetical protein